MNLRAVKRQHDIDLMLDSNIDMIILNLMVGTALKIDAILNGYLQIGKLPK